MDKYHTPCKLHPHIDEIKMLLADEEENWSFQKLANKYKVTRNTVAGFVWRNGLNLENKNQKLNQYK